MKPEISIEFFPPQTPEGMEKLRSTRAELAKLNPEFFSVTYGAGGSTRERTFAVVEEIAAEGCTAAPHLSCIGSTRASIREILGEYKAIGIKRIVALRGDLPSGMAETGEFRYANELVEFIRAETGDWFSIAVAAYPEWHPQAKSTKDDLDA
ncbi:MAG: methylenetetrahydrofolate reductase, partial [Azonexus sp.]